MKMKSMVLVAMVASALAVPGLAQQPAASSGTAKAKPAAPVAAVQPALAPLVAPRAAELAGAGITKIVARTGKQRRDIQVLTRWGPAYFPWPKGVKPETFTIEGGANKDIVVRADGYTEGNRASYAAAFDAVFPQAVRVAGELRAKAELPHK